MQSEIKPLGYILGPMLSAFTRPLKLRLKQMGIPYTLEHLVLLKKISEFNDMAAQQEIAEKLGKDKSVVLRIVDILENDGLLKRQVDATDRRRNLLVVTEIGQKHLEQFSEIELEVTKKLVHNIQSHELDTFYNVIAKLKENAEKI